VSRTRAQAGKLSRTKGKEFERWLARDLRELIGEPAVESAGDVRTSRVRRGEQGHGAVHPDVRVEGLPFWFECQHAARPDPEAKLQQARADSAVSGEKWIPVAVVRRSGARGKHQVQVCMYLGDLLEVLRRWDQSPTTVELSGGRSVAVETSTTALLRQFPVTFDYALLMEVIGWAEKVSGARWQAG
jgi:hypothetical protein